MPSGKTNRATRKRERLALLRQTVEAGGGVVTPALWAELRARFAGVSESTLRHDLREVGLAMHPLVEGVRLDSLDELERTLLALAAWYAGHVREHASETRNAAREAVLAARKNAEYVLRNPKVDAEKRAAMDEKYLWLRTWLENPLLFAGWAPLRRRQSAHPDVGGVHPST